MLLNTTLVQAHRAHFPWTKVSSEAKALAIKAKDVASAAAAKKTALTQTWAAMSDGMPKVVEARRDHQGQRRQDQGGGASDHARDAGAGCAEGLSESSKALASRRSAVSKPSVNHA